MSSSIMTITGYLVILIHYTANTLASASTPQMKFNPSSICTYSGKLLLMVLW